jgi:hypothetical protein
MSCCNNRLTVTAAEFPSVLRKVWEQSDEVREHIIQEKQKQAQENQNKAPAPSTADSKKAEADAKTEEEREAVRDKEKEKEHAQIYAKIAARIIEKAQFLLKVAAPYTAPSLTDAAAPASSGAGSGSSGAPQPPKLMRSVSAIAPSASGSAPRSGADSRATEDLVSPSAPTNSDQAVTESLKMWKDILSRQTAVNLPSLTRQVSIGAAAPANPFAMLGTGKKKEYTLSDMFLQYLKSDVEVDPAEAALRAEKEKKQKKPGGADKEKVEAGLEEEEQQLELPRLEQLLVIRRLRALSRAAAFRYFRLLVESSPFLSAQHEALRFLAPALRGEPFDAPKDEDKEEEDELTALLGIKKKKKAERTTFHYSDNTHGTGPALAAQLSDSFKGLFVKLGTILKSQLEISEANASTADSKDVKAAAAAAAPASAAADSALSNPDLSLAALACFAQGFTRSDHAFLDQSGIIHLVRRLMEIDPPKPVKAAKVQKQEEEVAADASAGM